MATDRITPALLLIADISGYTQFLRRHTLTNSHARQIIVRLLKSLVAAARPPLRVAELEGDAVFFYALAAEDAVDRTAMDAKAQILRLFRVFNCEIDALQKYPMCKCEACMDVQNLKLKQVAHCGEVTVERIGRFEKLFGLDVVVVHRMLKNSVTAKEYLMMTEAAYSACMDFYALEPERRTENLDGIGPTNTVVFYGTHFEPILQSLPDDTRSPSMLEMVVWKLKMHARTLLDLLRPTSRTSARLTGTSQTYAPPR